MLYVLQLDGKKAFYTPSETHAIFGFNVTSTKIRTDLEALFAGPITNASMNPARSLAPNIVSGNITGLWLYMIAPVIGALLAVVSCKLVKDDNCCDEDC